MTDKVDGNNVPINKVHKNTSSYRHKLAAYAPGHFCLFPKELLHLMSPTSAIAIAFIIDAADHFLPLSKIEDWFYYTVEDMKRDTGMSKHLQAHAIDELVGLRILEVKSMGMPQRRHFKIDPERLDELVQNYREEQYQETQKLKILTSGQLDIRPANLLDIRVATREDIRMANTYNNTAKQETQLYGPLTAAQVSEPQSADEPITNKPTTRHFDWAMRLRQLIDRTKELGGILGKFNSAQWARSFLNLEKEINGSIQIENVIVRYEQHASKWKELGLPQVRNAKYLCEPNVFVRLDLRLQQLTTQKPTPPITPDAERISTELKHLHWPKGSASQLPQAVQRGLENITELKNHLKVISQEKENEKPTKLARLAQELYSSLPPPKSFVRRWFEEQNERIQFWEGWSGHLEEFKLSSNTFQKYCRDVTLRYCGKEARWDELNTRLKELL